MLWKESCCGSSVTCKTLEVVEAVVLCMLCVSVAMCGVVPVRCAVCCCSVSVTVAVGCCGCGSGVVVGARGGAGVVVGSSSLAPGCFGGSCCCHRCDASSCEPRCSMSSFPSHCCSCCISGQELPCEAFEAEKVDTQLLRHRLVVVQSRSC